MAVKDGCEFEGYKCLYRKLILDRANVLIMSYRQQNGNRCSYHFKHHALEINVTDRLVKLLIDNVVFYSYNSDEIENKYVALDFDELEVAAAEAFGERLAKREDWKTDGLVGELMLDILIQKLSPDASKIFTRTKYTQQNDNQEIKGYDAAFFLRHPDDNIELWLGQAKAGGKQYCIDGVCKDINKDGKYLDKYFSKALRYIRDRGADEIKDTILINIIKELNTIISTSYKKGLSRADRETHVMTEIMNLLANRNVSIVIPCLIMFDSDIYNSGGEFTVKMENLCRNIYSHFEEKQFTHTDKISVKILILILPTKDLRLIKQKICDFKKGV